MEPVRNGNHGEAFFPDGILRGSRDRVSGITDAAALKRQIDHAPDAMTDTSRRDERIPDGIEENGIMKTSKAVAAAKRTLDIVVGLIGTAAYAAAYPVLALLIKLESNGPVIYRQTRVGMDSRSALGRLGDSRRVTDVGGRPFTIAKFRTMRQDAEKHGPQLFAKGGDPRVTRIGRFLRSTHLDELPQFWSVLKGDMSFIGPRPERPHFTVRYFREIPMYRERTRGVKPGITGLSQIVLGYDEGLESIARKTHFDLAYRASMISLGSWLRMELWILANTVRYLLQRGPLTEAKVSRALAGLTAGAAKPQIAMVRHRGTLRPTVVLAHSRPETDPAPAAPAGGRQPAEAAVAQPPISNFFTIDVECWFHAHNLGISRSAWDASPSRVVGNVHRILELLAAHEAKATFFVLGYVADRFPEVVRMIDMAGHEIGTHGHSHELVTSMSPYEFEKDLDRSLNSIARSTSRKIAGHRASNFSIVESTLWALDILARYGIEYDSSIFPVKRKRYGIPEYPNRMPHVIDLGGGRTIKEIPMSVAAIGGRSLPIAGGGYLRLYPHAATDLFIRRENRLGRPAMVYFHPWELDTEQQRVSAGLLESFQHYVNLDTTAWKLDRLLDRHAFGSIQDVLKTPALQAMLAQAPVGGRFARPVATVPGAEVVRPALPLLSSPEGLLAA
jgi:polysaccharide deacetylase family protein (PEP-CTERM system associated)